MAQISYKFLNKVVKDEIYCAYYNSKRTFFILLDDMEHTFSNEEEHVYELYEYLGYDLITFINALKKDEIDYIDSINQEQTFFLFKRNYKMMNEQEMKEKFGKKQFRYVMISEGTIYYPVDEPVYVNDGEEEYELPVFQMTPNDPEAYKDLNNILDKINNYGLESLKLQEHEFLKRYEKDS